MTTAKASQASEGIMRSIVENGFLVTFAAVVLVCGVLGFWWLMRFLFHEEKGIIRNLINIFKSHLTKLDESMSKLAESSQDTVIILKELKTGQVNVRAELMEMNDKFDNQKKDVVKTYERMQEDVERVLSETQKIQIKLAEMKQV